MSAVSTYLAVSLSLLLFLSHIPGGAVIIFTRSARTHTQTDDLVVIITLTLKEAKAFKTHPSDTKVTDYCSWQKLRF